MTFNKRKFIEDCKEWASLISCQLMLVAGLCLIASVAKAETKETTKLNQCEEIQVQPLENGVVISDGIETYKKEDLQKALALLYGHTYETYNNNGFCTVRYETMSISALSKIQAGKPLVIGVRGSSIPVSFEHPKGSNKYIGLAVDVCLSAVEKIKKQYPAMTYEFREVTSSNRIPMLNDGRIDMECGSTTANFARIDGNKDNKGVNFSIPYYWANIVGVTRKDNKLNKISDLKKGNSLIYTKGTTTEKAIEKYSIVFKTMNESNSFDKVIGNDHDESFRLLTEKKGDVFANDDILIFALIAKSEDRNIYKLLDDKLSVEPYAVMTRKNDDWLSLQVNKSIHSDMKSGKFDIMYDRWFMQSIPPFNQSMGIPQSPRLKETVRFPLNVFGG